MNIAFFSVCNDNYFIYLAKLFRSIKKHNPRFDFPWYVICDGRLSDKTFADLQKEYSGFRRIKADGEKYKANKKFNLKYYSIEMFNYKKHYPDEQIDRAIFLDCDMICNKKIADLLHLDCDIGMMRERRRPDSFNAGVIALSGKLLTKENYDIMMSRFWTGFGHDQCLYNGFFKGKITEIDIRFNALVSELSFVKREDIIFYHYIYKPRSKAHLYNDKKDVLKLWQSY